MNKRVLITGVGGVGSFAAHLLARLPGVELFLGDVRTDYIPYKANAVRDNAFYTYADNPFPSVQAVNINLMDTDATAAQLAEIKPDVILHLASLLSAQKIRSGLPVEIARTIYDANPVGTGLRPWGPGQTVLLLNLMNAIQSSGIKTHVVNGSGCDYLHVAFSKFGMAPTCGLGDFALHEAGIRRIVARQLNLHPRDISVYVAGHHSIVMPLAYFGETQGIPYYVKVEALGEDVTEEIDIEKNVFPNLPAESSWPAEAGAADQEQTAAHAVRIVRSILFDTQEVLNIPAPQGLPGCYPARVGADGVTVIAPKGTTFEQLVAINADGNKAEGFEEIQDDGTMVATARTIELVEQIFGIDWQYKAYHPTEAMEAFKEISEALTRFKSSYQ